MQLLKVKGIFLEAAGVHIWVLMLFGSKQTWHSLQLATNRGRTNLFQWTWSQEFQVAMKTSQDTKNPYECSHKGLQFTQKRIIWDSLDLMGWDKSLLVSAVSW